MWAASGDSAGAGPRPQPMMNATGISKAVPIRGEMATRQFDRLEKTILMSPSAGRSEPNPDLYLGGIGVRIVFIPATARKGLPQCYDAMVRNNEARNVIEK